MALYEDKIFPYLNDFVTKQFIGYRKKIAKDARGNVLEIGFGTGLSLPFYLEITKLTCIEPCLGMRDNVVAPKTSFEVDLIDAYAEELPFPDDSFDTVVSFLVLCTVSDIEKSINEIKRVLRPGGKLLFLEHVDWEVGSTQSFYHAINPLWKKLACGCNLNRKTMKVMEDAGLQVTKTLIKRPGPITPPIYYGSAISI